MKTIRFVLATALALVTLAVMTVPTPVLASPAYPQKGKACWVHDANGVQYTDWECDYQVVIKYDEDGNPIVLQYHDHGHLPPGAALPQRAMQRVFHVDSGMYQGDYMEVLMPNGAYMSHGPMKNNK